MLCVWSDACNVHKANIARSTYIESYKQQHCTLFIGCLSVDVTISQGHLGGWLVEFSIAHISSSSVPCIESKLGTNDQEDITQQIIALCISMLGIF